MNEKLNELMQELLKLGVPAMIIIADIEENTVKAGGLLVSESTIMAASEAFGADYFSGHLKTERVS